MITYVVKEKMTGHSFMSTRGTYEASTESLGEEIATALEARGFQVTKQDTTLDEADQ